MTHENIAARHRTRSGKVRRIQPKVPRHRPDNVARFRFSHSQAPDQDGNTIDSYRSRFETLVGDTNTSHQDAQYWAAYAIGPFDSHRELAEAAALYVIAMAEGLESARLYGKEICHAAPPNAS